MLGALDRAICIPCILRLVSPPALQGVLLNPCSWRVLEKTQSLAQQSGDLDWGASIDSTIVRVHQHVATLDFGDEQRMRSDKTARNHHAGVYLAATLQWLWFACEKPPAGWRIQRVRTAY